MKQQRTTITQVAELADVDISTVSRAIKNDPRISSATKDRVLAAVKRLDYHPNHLAGILAGNKSGLVGVLIDSCAPMSYFRILSMIERELASRGRRLMIAEAHEDIGSFAASCRTLQQYGVEGIISLAHDYPGRESQLKRQFRSLERIVFIGKPCFDTSAYVNVNRAHGVIEALAHLRRGGRQRIGLCAFDSQGLPTKQRTAAFLEEAKAQGGRSSPKMILAVPYDPAMIESNVRACMSFVLGTALDAILMPDDLHALGLMGELKRNAVGVPGKVAVVGYDNELFAALVSPKLSSIDEGTEAQAATAVRLLEGLIAGTRHLEEPPPEVKTRFVIRESTQV